MKSNWIYSPETLNSGRNWWNIIPMTLKFDGWPWKTIGHLFYAASSFVQHFVAIGEFKLELQSGNAQSGPNSTIFRAVWPWNLTKLHCGICRMGAFHQIFIRDAYFRWKFHEITYTEHPSSNKRIIIKYLTSANSTIFRAVRPWNLMDDLAKQ